MDVRTAHTAELDADTLNTAHTLLEVVFEGELDAPDWDSCLGGIHALAYEGEELVGHAALIQRHLVCDGRALRTGYVEGVGVRADMRRRGIAGSLMDVLEGMIRRAYDLGALGASDEGLPFYLSRGWRAWDGPLSILTPDGVVPTPEEEGGILVFDTDLSGSLLCADFRAGQVW
jgi:aminoglycoside 2'-N-acetyltransferase I